MLTRQQERNSQRLSRKDQSTVIGLPEEWNNKIRLLMQLVKAGSCKPFNYSLRRCLNN